MNSGSAKDATGDTHRTEALERRIRDLEELVERLAHSERDPDRLRRTVPGLCDHELKRLAGMLHDGPLQTLTAVAIMADVSARQENHGDLAGTLKEIANRVRDAAEEIRQMVMGLRSPGTRPFDLDGTTEPGSPQDTKLGQES